METSAPRRQMALAILRVDDRFALQLRDERPDISAPGFWGFFGGGIEPGEEPGAAMVREVEEELRIRPGKHQLFWYADRYDEFYRETVPTWIFETDVTDLWPHHDLQEGQATGLFALDDHARSGVHPFVREVMTRFAGRPLVARE